jgi:signal transduction histidine kinase
MTPSATPTVHFLIVDDRPENLTALDALLRRPGLTILKASSGKEALELLLIHDVALALVDVQMPGMDGFELAELMRGAERTRRVPIIFVTAGGADRQRRFRGYEAGAVDFLNKPIEADILRSKADVFFELYRQRQEVAQQRDELKAAAEQIQLLLLESQRQAEALREADQRKDDFLATLAHELRNPLAPIRNAVEVVKLKVGETEDVRTPLDIAARQIGHMSRLIEDLLDVARIVKGKIELRLEPCDVIQIVRQTVDDYRPTLENAGIALETEFDAEQFRVQGDPIRLAQVVGNLLHNAGKFTPRGGKVTVRAKRDANGQSCTISVADTGIGFDVSNGVKLFEPFSQSLQDHDDRKGGLGLGLALAKGLVELHRGMVTAESVGLGHGATFAIHLPAAPEDADAGAPATPHSADVDKPLSILVIEDNVDSARSLQLLLSLLGHRVAVAHDGDAGIRAAGENLPAVVISDLGLPGQVDGYAVARALRSQPKLHAMQLIALTGYGQENDRARALEAGFDQHLTKPVEIEALKRALAGTLASSHS